jgi:hypothetical protein
MLVGNPTGVHESFKESTGDVLLHTQGLLATDDKDRRLYFAELEIGAIASGKSA